jgi:hypothetical protein
LPKCWRLVGLVGSQLTGQHLAAAGLLGIDRANTHVLHFAGQVPDFITRHREDCLTLRPLPNPGMTSRASSYRQNSVTSASALQRISRDIAPPLFQVPLLHTLHTTGFWLYRYLTNETWAKNATHLPFYLHLRGNTAISLLVTILFYFIYLSGPAEWRVISNGLPRHD